MGSISCKFAHSVLEERRGVSFFLPFSDAENLFFLRQSRNLTPRFSCASQRRQLEPVDGRHGPYFAGTISARTFVSVTMAS
jgi:hypothetical protein